jgi:glycosyltransferase involved in cell wall biosynthesis
MRILYFYQYFSTSKGSWGTRVHEFAQNWVAAGHEVIVVTAIYAKSDIKASRLIEDQFHDGIKVKVINVLVDNKQPFLKRMWTFVQFMCFSSWFALTLPADIVIASSGPITVGLPGLIARYLRGKKLVFEARDLWPAGAVELGMIKNKTLARLAYAFEKRCYKASAHIVTLSPGMSQDIEKRYGFRKQTSVTNAANIPLFSTNTFRTTPFTGTQYAIYTGNIGEVNNSLWLLDAARLLKSMGREDIIVLLIGEGQQREQLEEIARKERIANFVRLGLMPKEDLVTYIQQAMISLVPLKGTPVLDTSSPNKFFESLAAGVPVIQNTSGWMKDFLDRHQVGFTLDANDPQALADLLIKISDKPDEIKRMGERAKKVAVAHFDKDILSRRMLKVLQDVHAQN